MISKSPRQAFIVIGIVALTACTRHIGPERFRTQFLPTAPKPAFDLAATVEIAEAPKLTPRALLKDVPTFIATQPKAASRITMEDLVRQAEDHFQEGKRLYQAGDVMAARTEFDGAIDTLLSVPGSVPDRYLVEKKLQDLADRIHRMDVEGLGASDNQQTATYERSPLQEILEMTFPINPEIKVKVHDQIRITTSQLPLDENDAVLRYINYFSTNGKGTIAEGVRRSGRYQPMISRILAEEGIPQELIFLAQAESGFQARAVSHKAAAGMWQFVRVRGIEYGLKQTAFTDDRLDPEKATRAGARHLKDLYKQFGDWYLAMAAYNCGPGCVARAVERTGYADFWELRSRNVLPNETANYVPLIVAMTIVAKNMEDYGIPKVTMEAPMEFERLSMTANTSLQLAADLSDVSLATLREFNPSLLGGMIPSGFELKVPADSKELLSAALTKIPPEKRSFWRTHRVAEGETAASIGRRYGILPPSVTPVGRTSGDELRAGDVVIIQAAAYVAPPRVARKYTPSTAHKASSVVRGRPTAAVRKPSAPVRRGSYAAYSVNRSRSVNAR